MDTMKINFTIISDMQGIESAQEISEENHKNVKKMEELVKEWYTSVSEIKDDKIVVTLTKPE